MDTANFLQILERELRTRDTQRETLSTDISAAVMDAALRRGQEYRAMAVEVAMRQMGLALKRGLRSLNRPLRHRHKHPATSPGSS